MIATRGTPCCSKTPSPTKWKTFPLNYIYRYYHVGPVHTLKSVTDSKLGGQMVLSGTDVSEIKNKLNLRRPFLKTWRTSIHNLNGLHYGLASRTATATSTNSWRRLHHERSTNSGQQNVLPFTTVRNYSKLWNQEFATVSMCAGATIARQHNTAKSKKWELRPLHELRALPLARAGVCCCGCVLMRHKHVRGVLTCKGIFVRNVQNNNKITTGDSR